MSNKQKQERNPSRVPGLDVEGSFLDQMNCLDTRELTLEKRSLHALSVAGDS